MHTFYLLYYKQLLFSTELLSIWTCCPSQFHLHKENVCIQYVLNCLSSTIKQDLLMIKRLELLFTLDSIKPLTTEKITEWQVPHEETTPFTLVYYLVIKFLIDLTRILTGNPLVSKMRACWITLIMYTQTRTSEPLPLHLSLNSYDWCRHWGLGKRDPM